MHHVQISWLLSINFMALISYDNIGLIKIIAEVREHIIALKSDEATNANANEKQLSGDLIGCKEIILNHFFGQKEKQNLLNYELQ